MTSPSKERIAKRIAASGLCSRREAERLIENKQVTLNNQLVLTPATLVSAEDVIHVQGKKLNITVTPKLFAYYKPTGELVTESDPQGRRTIYDSLPDMQERLIPVGRLDLNSEGLLLLSNSPKVVSELMHSNLPRTYRVRVFGKLSPQQESQIQIGLKTTNMQYAPAHISIEKAQGKNTWYYMTLTEGKNREIRNIFEHFNIQVNRLIRLQYGDIKLGALKPCQIKEIPIQVL